jgi:2'-5' RNA ligase
MRAFLAIPMPEHVADDLAALTAHLRTGRAVASDDLHLTLAFLGDVTLAQLDALHMSLEMLHVAPFSLRLAGLDLPDPIAPRAVYIRADGGAPLADLQARVQRAVRSAGIDLARSRFRPHVTLARFGRHPGPQALSQLGGFLAARGDTALAPFSVAGFALYRAILHQDGAEYEILETYPVPLAAGPNWA